MKNWIYGGDHPYGDYGADYMSEAYGPTADDAAYFGVTEGIYDDLEAGHITDEEAEKLLAEARARYGKHITTEAI